MSKPLIINTDVRTTRISSNSLIPDDNSNQSSTNSSSQHTSSRIFGQMIKSSEQQILSSSSPLSNDIKLSALDHDSMQANINANASHRHSCVHPNCNKTFTNKSALAKHKLTHSQDRKHVCLKCNKGFKRLDHLNGHMLTHQEEKPHKCGIPNCNRTYCDARSLKRHIENTHQDILAAIHESGQEEYKKFLPDKAFVKTKDLSLQSEFSIDSVDSSSPRSLVDSEPSFNIRTSTGAKSMITYTFDEEKSIECQICKKSFKSGAALNGHMRLHGGFIEKPALLPSTSTKEKTKRTTTTKRKRTDSPSASVTIKTEAHDRSMNILTNNFYQQQSSFAVRPSSSNTIQNQFYDRTISSPGRPSPSSSGISTPTTTIPQYQIQNPMRVQSPAKQTRKQNQGPTHVVQPSQMNLQNVIIPFDTISNSQLFTNVRSPSQQYEEKLRESFSNEHNAHFSQSNGMPSHNPYLRSPHSFHWPSQLRRQLSLNLAKQTLNPLPSTPYTPPPMLSPFRRGPGLYYRVFSHPGTCTESPSIPTTPLPPGTPVGEESTVPKINIGRDYQANIPKLRTNFDDDDDAATGEELLFSPTQLSCLDEKSLETFEELNRRNPFLFSPRDSPKAYPLELIYMLLHEYNGDLSRTLAALLEGTAKDIKQCRQLHCYHFLDCDTWTKEEIDAFTKAIQTSEKNFGLVSRAVGTKSVKQCIEFYYMPKVSVTARKISSTRTTAVMTRRKRFQINKAKQQLLDDEISSSSPFSEFRIDDDGSTMHSDGSPAAQFPCDIDGCSQIFTSERACRAHRKDHRRTNNNMTTSWTVTKRSRNVD
ncbi:unnamed protein product [Rotaria magnacalcarata]|uniref:Uncharacterized protein n=1 Tax=Rotaria magnacalcarata TaxID=392030 RepID=A0A8S2J2R8_9BILA|nr:unnamed protein product [Rotaria magnacalcarata]